MLDQDCTPTDIARKRLVRFLKTQVNKRKVESSEQASKAYVIAGLLSAKGICRLSSDDPISRVLELAAQVELPAHVRATTDTWGQLVKAVDQL